MINLQPDSTEEPFKDPQIPFYYSLLLYKKKLSEETNVSRS